MTNDIKAIENKFVTSLGSGKAALEHASTLIHSVVDSRDTTVLTRAMTRAKSKGDDKACASMRLILLAVWPKAVLKFDTKAKAYVFKIKGIEAEEWALEALSALVDDGASLRGSLITKTFKADKTETAFDAVKWAERQEKAHPDQLEAMIAALQALRA